jgi:predicted KAP-like P-loop ATPase
MASKPKDIPALKDDIAELLRESEQRVVVFIDDIDRLAPEEVRVEKRVRVMVAAR